MSGASQERSVEARQVEKINELTLGMIVSRGLQIAADLGVADWIDDSPATAVFLAGKVGANADALARILRLLSRYGVFEERGAGFAHSALSRFLRTDHPQTQRPWVRQVGSNFSHFMIRNLDHSARTGESAVAQLDPPDLFSYLATHPDDASLFDAGMMSKSLGDIAAILRAYDFSSFATIGDIGGGQGHLVRAILEAAPRAKGILFDQPHVVEAAPPDFSGRLTMIGGDFFKSALPACNCYTMMSVIHDWNDEESIAILKAARNAAPSGARLLLLELLLPERQGSPYALLMDVAMLAVTGGRERKLSEYETLLKASGWRLDRAIPTDCSIAIVEATAA